MKKAVFWDVASCGFIINRRFGGTVSSIFRAVCHLPSNTFPHSSYFFYPEDGGDMFLRNFTL
jgi:hypothetical protein